MTTVTNEADMDNEGFSDGEARGLRFLRLLVTVLTVTMIVGVLAIVALLVIRLQSPALPSLPDFIALPEGATVGAVTYGAGWIGVVTDDDRFLVFSSSDGRLLDEVEIDLD